MRAQKEPAQSFGPDGIRTSTSLREATTHSRSVSYERHKKMRKASDDNTNNDIITFRFTTPLRNRKYNADDI